MRFHARHLLLLIIALLAVLALAFFALNLILQLPSVEQSIQGSMERSLGTPIVLSDISFTYYGDIRVQEIFSKEEGSSSFLLKSVVIHPLLLNLFQGEVIIRSMSINHAVLRGSLSASGPVSSFSRSTILSMNSFQLISAEGISLTGTQTSVGEWKGLLTAKKITLGSSVILHDTSSLLILSANAATLTLNNLTSTLGGGTLAGSFSLDLPPDQPKFQTQLTLSGATLNEFSSDASLGSDAAEGAITGNLQLSGIMGSSKSLEGQGTLLCTNAVIHPAGFLKQIGEILQIQELQLLRLSEGKILYRVHQGDVQFDQLALHSENLILTAQGPLHSNGDFDLQARLLFNEKLSGRLHGFLGPQLTPAPEAGYHQVAFHIFGPVKNPKTDLLERLTGIHIDGDLGGLLQGLFGPPPPPNN